MHVPGTNVIKKGIVTLLLAGVFLCVGGILFDSGLTAEVYDSGLGAVIKKKVTDWKNPLKIFVGGERIYSSVLVEGFYKRRSYRPAWILNGHLVQADTLMSAIKEAYGDGLTPDYYHLGLIKSLVNRTERKLSTPAQMADLDILLTDAFITLGCHLSGGCVNPVTIESEWFAKRKNVDVSAVLERAVKNRQVKETLLGLRPDQGSYARLRQALGQYREQAAKGEWPRVSGGPFLKKGSTSHRVAELRTRLATSGDMEADEAKAGDLFDEKLERSVSFFQRRHGIKDDGVVGPVTLNALNVPLKQRIRQMELNLERLRWILGNIEERCIVVNIADFKLSVIENGKAIFSMKVVVGKPYQRTPVFTAKMTYLVINPRWNIPESIAREEILDKVKKDPHYLARENIKVLRGWGAREEEIDPETVNWSRISPSNLAYKFRQEPGPSNPLGSIKFMLPNKYDVYLHDTASRRLFSESVRTFSHGCTRIEKPIELGEYLLRDSPGWTRERLLDSIGEGTEQRVPIPRPLDVHFLYLTAWVDSGGTVQFRNDIYGRDALLDEALRKKPSFH